MKVLVALTLAALATTAFGQIPLTDAGRLSDHQNDRHIASMPSRRTASLPKDLAALNEGQESFSFSGQILYLDLPDREIWLPENLNWFFPDIAAKLTTESFGARVGYDLTNIDIESRRREYLRSNPDIDQSTVPSTGTIKNRRWIFTFHCYDLSSRQSYDLFFGSGNALFAFSADNATYRYGISLTVTDADDLTVSRVYRSIGQIRKTDHLNLVIGTRNLSLGGGYAVCEHDYYVAALKKALDNLLIVLDYYRA